MPNFPERMRQRRAAIAAGNAPAPPPAPAPRPVVPQPSFAGWPITLPSPPPTVDEARQMIVEPEVVEVRTAVVEELVDDVGEAMANFEAMTYRELQAFLKSVGLSATGTKADMLVRAIGFVEEPKE